MTLRPVATDPVNTTMFTPLLTSSAPTSPLPCTICTRPRGTPASSRKARIRSAMSGVNSLGFSTTPLPAMSAITVSPAGMENG